MSSTYAQVGRSVAREWQKLTCRLCSDLHFSGPRRLSGGQSVGGEFDACESAVTRGFFLANSNSIFGVSMNESSSRSGSSLMQELMWIVSFIL